MSGRAISVAVLGPGGIGGFLAAMLARSGSEVVVLAREATAREIASSGVHLESAAFGDVDVAVRSATSLESSVDAVLVAVKATQLAEALERVPPRSLGGALVIPFLNGFDHVERLRAVYPPTSVVAATIRIEATRVRPGVIRHTSPFARVELAAAPENLERVERFASCLSASGVEVRIRDDERAMLWEKFALLGPMALLTTLARADAGTIRTSRRADAEALIREVASVAAAEGVAIDAQGVLGVLDSVPAPMQSSMQRDQEAGRPLELDALGGALLRRAAAHRIDVPVTRRIVGELEERSAGRSSATG